MQRVQQNGEWSLFCPNEAPGLADCWGEEFDQLYTQYEREVNSSRYGLFALSFYLFLSFYLLKCDLLLMLYCNLFYIQGKAKKVVQAQNLWFEILKSQIETGTPYMLFKVRLQTTFGSFTDSTGRQTVVCPNGSSFCPFFQLIIFFLI